MDQLKLAGWGQFFCRPAAVWVVWAGLSVLALIASAVIGLDPFGPDDHMRILQVRDLLAGQSWWDVSQYRIDPPQGAAMHWSRLVDIPLAIVATLFGELAAMVIVPLAYALPVLFALQRIMLRLHLPPLAIAFGLLCFPMYPLLAVNFIPMRIDHHTLQAVMAAIAAVAMLGRSWKSAAIGGLAAGAWVVVSLEGLPLIAVMAGLYGMAYWLWDERRLAWFLGALALSAPALSLATRPISEFSQPYCDILMPGHMAGFAAAAIVAALLPFAPGQGKAAGRLAGLVLLGVVSAPLAFVTLGSCAANPFATLDPLVVEFWHSKILEGLPIWEQRIPVAAVVVWTLILVPAGFWTARRGGASFDKAPREWVLFTLFALASCLFAFILMRAIIVAQIMTIPFSAILFGHYLPRARAMTGALPRILATIACFLLTTPVLAGNIFSPFDAKSVDDVRSRDAAISGEPEKCDFTRLDALPQSHLFALMDSGPMILFQTDHTIVAANYHRNEDRMVQVITAYTGSSDAARDIVRDNRADFVVICTLNSDLELYREAGEGNFADAVATGEVPDWLEPVEGFAEDPLRVYRVK